MTNTMASAISLSRAISKRISHRDSHNPLTSFSNSIKLKRHSDMGIKKGLISSPVELISTTNSQLFTAPSVGTVRISTSIEIPPSPESSTAGSPPPLTPDREGYHGLPTPPMTPLDDKMFLSFSRQHSRSGSAASTSTDASYGSSRRQLPNRVTGDSAFSSTTSSATPPPIPQRKSSTSSRKSNDSPPTVYSFFPPPPKSQKRLNRSLSNGSLRSATNSQAIGASNKIEYNVGSVKRYPGGMQHPFGKELAQVSELAEEMGLDLDEECMLQKGLHRFSAEEYLAEVEDIVVVKGLFGRKASVKLGGIGWI